MKRNEVLIHAAAWMTIENITLSVRSPSQKGHVLLDDKFRIGKSIEIESRIVVTEGWWEEGGERLLVCMEYFFAMMNISWN